MADRRSFRTVSRHGSASCAQPFEELNSGSFAHAAAPRRRPRSSATPRGAGRECARASTGSTGPDSSGPCGSDRLALSVFMVHLGGVLPLRPSAVAALPARGRIGGARRAPWRKGGAEKSPGDRHGEEVAPGSLLAIAMEKKWRSIVSGRSPGDERGARRTSGDRHEENPAF